MKPVDIRSTGFMRFDGIPANAVLVMDDTLPGDIGNYAVFKKRYNSNSHDYSSVMGLSFLLKSNHIVLLFAADFRYKIFL